MHLCIYILHLIDSLEFGRRRLPVWLYLLLRAILRSDCCTTAYYGRVFLLFISYGNHRVLLDALLLVAAHLGTGSLGAVEGLVLTYAWYSASVRLNVEPIHLGLAGTHVVLGEQGLVWGVGGWLLLHVREALVGVVDACSSSADIAHEARVVRMVVDSACCWADQVSIHIVAASSQMLDQWIN